MVSVRERLRHAVSVHAASASPPMPPPARRERPPLAELLRGEWHETPHGPVFIRDEWFPLAHKHGARPLAAGLEAHSDGLALLLGASDAPDPAGLAYFDIETTGLSSGTGTYMVLAGLGSFEAVVPGEPLAFRMRQYFLADIAHEHAMLAMLRDDLARFEGIVTYNGRAFDLPFVQTRMTLARLRSPCDAMPHFDLLHPVRRLYKHRMPACRLADAERRLLRIERMDDLPGSLIPAIYFDYLRAGRIAPLRGMFRHNGEDVLSLVGVLTALSHLLASSDLDPEDAVAVARWWEAHGDEERASVLYDDALPWLVGGDDWAWAAARQARLHRRRGRRAEAASLWAQLWQFGDQRAGLELAKHLEHHERDFAHADAVVARLLDDPACDHEALGHRRERLRRKLSKQRVVKSAAIPMGSGTRQIRARLSQA